MPRGPENPRDRAIHRAVQIGILKHHERRFPAQLQRHLREIFRRIAQDMTRRIRATGEGNLGHQRVGRQRLPARVCMACHDIDHPVRNARLGCQPAKLQQRRAGMFRRFQHNRVAGRQRGADLDRRQENLAVPRDHRGHHTDRFAGGENEHVGFVDGQRLAVDLVGSPCKKVKIFSNIGCLPGRFFEHLSGVARLDPADLFGIGGQQIGQTVQRLAARGGRHLPPFSIQRPIGRAHRAVHILCGGFREAGPGFARGRID